MAPKRKSPQKKAATPRKQVRRRAPAAGTGRKWSAEVTATSDAMTLEPHVFTKQSPKQIALSVKRSAERSHRRKSSPFRSAMSMLTFYENRAGKNLSATQREKLEKTKEALRAAFDRD